MEKHEKKTETKSYRSGVCVECKVRDGDSSKKKLYQCPYCGRWFCEKHIEPRIATTREAIEQIRDPVLRDNVLEEWRKPNGHPDIVWTKKYFEDLRKQEEEQRQKFWEAVEDLKRIKEEKEFEKTKKLIETPSITFTPKPHKKRIETESLVKTRKINAIPILLIVGIISFIALVSFMSQSGFNLFKNNVNASYTSYTNIQNYTESKTEGTISPKSEYRIYIKEVQEKCHSINGEAFLFSENGYFETTINNSVIYLHSPFRGNLSIYFSLEDGNCEVNDVPRDIKIIFTWQNVSDNETLFFNISRKNFHYPEYLIEFTNFVRPRDVKWFIDSFRNQIPEFEYDALDYIKKRAQVSAKYYFDIGDYWQFPNETLKRGYGDCEDFSTLLLSLFKAYNENLKCYNLVVYRHLTTFCILYFEKDYPTFAFFDQGDTRIRENWYNAITEYEKCNRIRALVENFYSSYGLTPVENKVIAAFDDKNVYTFDNMDEFCKWIISIA